MKAKIHYGKPRYQPPPNPEIKHVIPPRKQIVHNWQFPLGGKAASLSITGWTEITTDDMDALIEVSTMFKAQVARSNAPTEPEYSI